MIYMKYESRLTSFKPQHETKMILTSNAIFMLAQNFSDDLHH